MFVPDLPAQGYCMPSIYHQHNMNTQCTRAHILIQYLVIDNALARHRKKGILLRYSFHSISLLFRNFLAESNNSARHLTFLAHFMPNAIENWKFNGSCENLTHLCEGKEKRRESERDDRMQSMANKVV